MHVSEPEAAEQHRRGTLSRGPDVSGYPYHVNGTRVDRYARCGGVRLRGPSPGRYHF